MLSDTLANIRTTLNEHRFLTSAEISSVCDLLHMYRIGMWLYPGVIARRVPLSIENTYALTDLLTQMGYMNSTAIIARRQQEWSLRLLLKCQKYLNANFVIRQCARFKILF